MKLYDQIREYIPWNEQEQQDREVLLHWLSSGVDIATRNNPVAHLTASAWVISPDRNYVVMAYHNLYDSWAWLGGHADGEQDLLAVALREVQEETGLTLTDYRLRGLVTFLSSVWETEYMFVFTATGYEGELIECNEGDLEWIHKDRLVELPLWVGDKLFLERIHEPDTPFFSLKLRYEGDDLVYAALDGKELSV